jgi:hypothetical protein
MRGAIWIAGQRQISANASNPLITIGDAHVDVVVVLATALPSVPAKFKAVMACRSDASNTTSH